MKKYNKLQSILRRIRPGIIAALFCWGVVSRANAQVTITNPYPAAAQSLTRGLDTSLLTVEVNFLGACTGNIATITLAPGVTYIPGSVAKTAGNAGITIADLAGTANAPTFTIGGVTAAGSITFTLKRTAGCGTAASGKDVVSVTGSCGTVTESDINVNSYNLLSPALALTSPAAITGAFVGNTASRSITITNGGNGCLDTIHYYVVYPAGGIVNTNAGNAITANGVSFTPGSTNGDTLFYAISGATLFGGDRLLCNGETVTIVENIRVVKCNTMTSYGAGWGNRTTACQMATGSGTLTMATGVPNMTVSVGELVPVGACNAPGKVQTIYTNNGTGGNAGAIYNVVTRLGYSYNGSPLAGKNAGEDMNNFALKISPSVSIPLVITTAGTTATPYVFSLSQFTTDPDGANVGLEDLDGDGQFDDLAPGQSFTLLNDRLFILDSVNCPRAQFDGNPSASFSYATMCGNAVNAVVTNGGMRGINLANPTSSFTTPPQITNGVPFNIGFAFNFTYLPTYYRPTDSLELIITLPVGATYAGNAKYKGGAVDNVIQMGQTLQLHKKLIGNSSSYTNLLSAADFTFDLVYDCAAGGGGAKNFPVQLQYVIDNSCGAVEKIICRNLSINAICPPPCPTGVVNAVPVATRTSLGWTDVTMTARVNPVSLPALSLKTVTVFDTLSISSGATQVGSYNNLYYYFELAKSANADVVHFISGSLNYKASGSTTVINCPITTALRTDNSTTLATKWLWSLTSLVGGGCGIPAALNTGDSVWVDMSYRVTNANNGLLTGPTMQPASGIQSYLYNLDATNTPAYCGSFAPELYFIGIGTATPALYADNAGTLIGCMPVRLRTSTNVYHTNAVQPFPGEFRPILHLDSIVVILPVGVSYTNSVAGSATAARYTNKYIEAGISQPLADPIIDGQKLTFVNNGTWPLSDFSTHFNQVMNGIRFYVVADCRVPNVTGSLPVTISAYGEKYMYATQTPAIPYNSTQSWNSPAILGVDATKQASLSVQNNTGTLQGILPQHYWDVQVNSTGTTTAPYVWMALEKGAASGIVVDSVVLKPSNVVMTPMSYGTGNKWYQVSAAGLSSGASQQARVYFKYTNCTTDSILMRSGWSCTAYPSPDPATGYACTSADQYLKVIPQSSQVQIAMAYQPAGTINLCSQDSVTVIVNSAQAANLVNPHVVIYPPAGVTFSTPFPVEYPLGSGIWQPITPVSITGGGYQVNLSSHTGIGANGLPGTALNPGAAGRQAKIKLPFSVSCSFVSGSQLDFFVHGTKPCGNAADGDGLDVKSNPVKITGANATGNAAVSMSLSGSTTMTCGESRSIGLSVTAVGTTTQAGDTAVYAIPAGLNYAGNFSGCATCSITTAPTAGATLVKVALPVGLPSGTTTSFSFDIAAANGGGCGTLSVNGQVERSIGGLFCGMTPCTTSKVVIGTGTPVPVTVNKPNLTITALTRTTPGFFVPGSTHTLSVSVSNSGTIAVPASAYIVEFFCGSSSTPFASGSFPAAIAAGSSATANMTINVPAAPACNIGDAVTAKISPVTTTNTVQCMCSETMFTMSEVLPLRLVKFAAGMQECKATLSWKTVEEHNFRHFEVEYSANAHSFEKVGTIAGRNSASGGVYTFDYVQPAGKGYYRLKMVDLDGAAQLSNTIATEADCGAQNTITLYPNPTQGLVEVSNVVSGSILRVYDHTGRLLLSKVAQQAKEKIDLSGFAAGSYALVVINGTEQVFRAKVIRQ